MRSLPVLVLAVALATGCAPTLRVAVLRPAPVNLGPSRKLTIYQAEGLPNARFFVINQLQLQVRPEGYFRVIDRSHLGTWVWLEGRQVQLYMPQPVSTAPDETGLRLDVLDWSVVAQTRTVKEKDKKGKEIERQETTFTGHAALYVMVFNGERRLLAARELRASATEPDEQAAIVEAGKQVVAQLLRQLTPSFVQQDLQMDDSDAEQKPILKLADSGDLSGAAVQMRAYLARKPDSVSAKYNLAVMLDALGQYPEALQLYDEAISASPNGLYQRMRQECVRRMADQQALQE